MIRYTLAALVLTVSGLAIGGEFNPTLDIGAAAPSWSDLPTADGKKSSLADYASKDAVVVVFTCNSCPVAVDYEDRVIAFAAKYAGADSKVGVVAINVNQIPEDSLPKMKERADAKKFNFPYVFDETQKIAKDYGATFTPEFFVLDKNRKIAYMGAMDDQSQPAMVKQKYLEAAVDAILKGEPAPTKETVARGCRVRYARERRTK